MLGLLIRRRSAQKTDPEPLFSIHPAQTVLRPAETTPGTQAVPPSSPGSRQVLRRLGAASYACLDYSLRSVQRNKLIQSAKSRYAPLIRATAWPGPPAQLDLEAGRCRRVLRADSRGPLSALRSSHVFAVENVVAQRKKLIREHNVILELMTQQTASFAARGFMSGFTREGWPCSEATRCLRTDRVRVL